jgi:serine/threonine-protein kinase RsbW
VKLPSRHGSGSQFLDDLLRALRHEQWTEQEVFEVHLAVEEALVNALRHGNALDHEKLVHVNCRLNPQRFWVEVADEGTGFDPSQVPDCTADENLHRASGRGIMLMRQYMSRVEYLDGGHRVIMEKHRRNEELSSPAD